MIYTISNGILTVSANDEGAELTSIRSKDGTEYLWQGNPDFWRGQSPVLFPYIARLNNGVYLLDGKEYSMKIHGLAKYVTFELSEKTETSMTFSMEASEETLKQYPFLFRFTVTYTLEDDSLKMIMGVQNKDDKTMYFAAGGHPGFNTPLTEGLDLTDYYLEFSEEAAPVRVLFDEDVLVTGETVDYPLENGKIIRLRHDLFDHDAVVLKNASKTVTLKSDRDSRFVKVSYEDMPFVGFWHAVKKEAPYVCVEPWSALPSNAGPVTVLNEKEDLTALDAGKYTEKTITITIG